MIDLYTAPTPNGHKASCVLEELGLEDKEKAAEFARNARNLLQT